MAEGEASAPLDDEVPLSDGEPEAEADGDDSDVEEDDDSLFFELLDDFFDGEAEAEASALAPELELELFFVLVPEELVPDFLLDEVVLVPVVEPFFFEVVELVLLAVVELPVVSVLFAHAVTNASAARMLIPNKMDFFIDVREPSLS